MKRNRLIAATLAAFVLTLSSAAQTRVAGKITEVIDGRTVVIDTDGRKVTAEIQYIEVPEPDQPLHTVVHDHLSKLALGQSVEFHPQGFQLGKAFGQLYINSNDVALQMLRDGAAWHISAATSGQAARESDAYDFHENQARLENRGVWGVKGLKPPWEHRAERFEKERQAQIAADYAAGHPGEAKFVNASNSNGKAPTAPARGGYWSDRNPSMKDPGPLLHGYNAATRTGWLGTSLMGVKELENVPTGQKVACDVTYLYKQESEKSRKGTFVLTLISSADEWRFAKTNNLNVMVDEKSVAVGKPKRVAAKEEGKAVEKLTYEVNKATIEKIVYGGEVIIKIGDYSLYPGPGLQLLLYNMLQAAD